MYIVRERKKMRVTYIIGDTGLEDHTLHVVTACSPIVKHSIEPLCNPIQKQEVKIVVHVSLQLNGPVETHQPAAEC